MVPALRNDAALAPELTGRVAGLEKDLNELRRESEEHFQSLQERLNEVEARLTHHIDAPIEPACDG